MEDKGNYDLNMDIKYGYLTLIDLPKLIAECKSDWFNQSLCYVNDCVVRVGIVKGEFHWHKHDKEDEFFFILDGKLFLDFDNETVEVLPKQGYTVPKGIRHRTRAKEKTVMLMIEKKSVQPTGD
ncbi:MAG: cupin domain-containing protein, partial [Candidatus Hodarchaeota archaeon]